MTDPFVIAFLSFKDNIITPVVNPSDSIAKPILAFVFNRNQTNELGFLLLNGSDEVVTIEKPLTQASCIVATAPTIGYTNELHIVGQAPENISIEPGKVGEWRIPWPTINDLIPADDLAAIKAAGGDLDLAWRAGAYQSDPLPLSLAPPVIANGVVGGDNQQKVKEKVGELRTLKIPTESDYWGGRDEHRGRGVLRLLRPKGSDDSGQRDGHREASFFSVYRPRESGNWVERHEHRDERVWMVRKSNGGDDWGQREEYRGFSVRGL